MFNGDGGVAKDGKEACAPLLSHRMTKRVQVKEGERQKGRGKAT